MLRSLQSAPLDPLGLCDRKRDHPGYYTGNPQPGRTSLAQPAFKLP